MPYIVDLDKKCDKIYRIGVRPYGWIADPVVVEYGTTMINSYDPSRSVCFRVQGTKHVWAVFEKQLYQISKGDYASYFKKKLEEFRIDFLLWIHSPDYWQQGWVRDYYEMFKGLFYDFSEEERKQYEIEQQKFEEKQRIIDSYGSS